MCTKFLFHGIGLLLLSVACLRAQGGGASPVIHDLRVSEELLLRGEYYNKTDGGVSSFRSTVSIVSKTGSSLLVGDFSSDPKRNLGRLSEIKAAVASGSRIRAVVFWELPMDSFPGYTIWDISYGAEKATLNKASNMHFLRYKTGVADYLKMFSSGVSGAPNLSRTAVLSRGIYECVGVRFVDFTKIEVLWRDGDKDLIELNAPGDGQGVRVVNVVNAKEKIPGIDGVEREWIAAPKVVEPLGVQAPAVSATTGHATALMDELGPFPRAAKENNEGMPPSGRGSQLTSLIVGCIIVVLLVGMWKIGKGKKGRKLGD